MSEPTRQVLHEAAPAPHETPDFRRLWDSGRRRRRLVHAGVAIAAVAVLGGTAAATALIPRPADSHVDFAHPPSPTAATAPVERPAEPAATDPPAPSLPPPPPERGWRTVVVGDAAFDVPNEWPIYGDDGPAEYRDRFCELGQIGPAVFVAHPLPRNWGCRSVLLGEATGVQVVPVDMQQSERLLSVWLDEPSTTGEMGGEPITQWEQDERQADEWTLLRYERLGVYVHARIDLDRGLVFKVLRTFRKASAEDRGAEITARASERTEQTRRDREIADTLIGIAIGPYTPDDMLPEYARGEDAALGAIGGHFDRLVNARLDGSAGPKATGRSVAMDPQDAFTLISSGFRGCVDAYDGATDAGPSDPAPGPMQRYRRLSLRPAFDTIESCRQWFAVDIYVDRDGNVRDITLMQR